TYRYPPRLPLFPYTTLFRSHLLERNHHGGGDEAVRVGDAAIGFSRAIHRYQRDLALLHALRLQQIVNHIGLAVERRPDAFELARSEEHTSELQSRENLVCRL